MLSVQAAFGGKHNASFPSCRVYYSLARGMEEQEQEQEQQQQEEQQQQQEEEEGARTR